MTIIKLLGEINEDKKKNTGIPLSVEIGKKWSQYKKPVEGKTTAGFAKLDFYPFLAGKPEKPATVKFGPKLESTKGIEKGWEYIICVKKGTSPAEWLGVGAGSPAPPPPPPAPAKAPAPPPPPPAPAK
eukprot:Hpha_TRINITY_DN23290_c0_g1::TRINITY_DN23290_c0_g1_i1::g.30151::m.30151